MGRARATKRGLVRGTAQRMLRTAAPSAAKGNRRTRAASRAILRTGARPAVTGRLRRDRDAEGGGGKALALIGAGVGALAVFFKLRRSDGGAQYARDRAKGLAHEATSFGGRTPANDQDLVQHVRTNVLGRERWQPFTVNVDAADGHVTLRGQLDSVDAINELERQVADLSGVKSVENLLHMPGEPAPNIRDAEEASEEARAQASATRSGIE